MENKSLSRRISVVVLTHNRADELIAILERLLALPEHPPVFVADNASSDNTVALVKTLFPRFCVIECADNLGAAGRNRAAASVGTDYVAFCDDDTWWEPGSLARAVQLLDAWPNVGVLSARVVVGEDKITDPTCAVMRASPLGSEGLPGPSQIGYMALPWPQACRATLRALDLLAREGRFLRHSAGLPRGLTWALPRRRVVPAAVLSLRERVHAADRSAGTETARRNAKPAVGDNEARI